MKTRGSVFVIALAAASALGLGCSSGKVPGGIDGETSKLPGAGSVPEDTAPKVDPRLVPQEAYIRSYLALFGGLSPITVQANLKGSGLFDTWNDYLGALGVPGYDNDTPRGGQTNTLMLATFERVGVALCDKAVEQDLKAAKPMNQRVIFAFDVPAGALDQAAFASRFDVLHRTFLGYPSKLAPPDRLGRFFTLYGDAVASQSKSGAPKSLFTPEQAGWASVCYGLVRHPEFHTY